LKEKCAEALGITDYDPELLTLRVVGITLPGDGLLIFTFKDGTQQTLTWVNRSRRESWTPQMRELARQHANKGRLKNGN